MHLKVRMAITIKGLKAITEFNTKILKNDINDPGTMAHAVDQSAIVMATEIQQDVLKRYRSYADNRHPLTTEAYVNPSKGLTPNRVLKKAWGRTAPFQRSGQLTSSVMIYKRKAGKHRIASYAVGIDPRRTYRKGDPWDQSRNPTLKVAQVAQWLEEGRYYTIQPTAAMLAYLKQLGAAQKKQGTQQGRTAAAGNNSSTRDASKAADKLQAQPMLIHLPARPVWGPAIKALSGKPFKAYRKHMKSKIDEAVQIAKTKDTIIRIKS